MGFDVQSLLQMDLPDALCPCCAAILRVDELSELATTLCPSCLADLNPNCESWSQFFRQFSGCSFHNKEMDKLEHARELTDIAVDYLNGEIRALEMLFGLLQRSRHFVHFATWNFSTELLGAFAITALRIPVRGIIGEPLDKSSDAYKLHALNTFQEAIAEFEVKLTGAETCFDQTHQKLYVFDGIVALSGSPNLTLAAWKKVSESRELMDVVTDLEKVRQMNNRYISRFLPRKRPVPPGTEMSFTA